MIENPMEEGRRPTSSQEQRLALCITDFAGYGLVRQWAVRINSATHWPEQPPADGVVSLFLYTSRKFAAEVDRQTRTLRGPLPGLPAIGGRDGVQGADEQVQFGESTAGDHNSLPVE